MATSSEMFDEDIIKIFIEPELNGKIMLEIAAEVVFDLTENQEQLKQCKWTDGESNTDTDFSVLSCKCAEEAWLDVIQKYPQLSGITMTASPPDIICTFSINGKTIKVPKNKIELKSSKNHVMPGSTIGKLDINQPLIYCYRPKNPDDPYEIRYGQYHTAMGESDIDLFQDRTPRPQLNFTKLSPSSQKENIYSNKKKDAWISHYIECAVNRLHQVVTYSWQDTLTKGIFDKGFDKGSEHTKRKIHDEMKNIETMEDFIKFRESLGTA
jgi:hypothetical protein